MNSYELNEAQKPSCNRKSPNPETLRDRIAIAALQGYLASFVRVKPSAEEAAAEAYTYADAMLKAREK